MISHFLSFRNFSKIEQIIDIINCVKIKGNRNRRGERGCCFQQQKTSNMARNMLSGLIILTQGRSKNCYIFLKSNYHASMKWFLFEKAINWPRKMHSGPKKETEIFTGLTFN